MAMKIRIGATETETEKNPIEIMEENTFLVAVERPTADGEMEWVPAVSFTTATGQGTSPEVIPVDEFEEYVEVLEAALENGIPEKVEKTSAYRPAPEVLEEELYIGEYKTPARNSLGKIVKGEFDEHGERVFFRSQTGQGRKKQIVRPEQFAEVVAKLRAEVESLPEYKKHWEVILPDVLKAARLAAQKEAEKAAKAAAKKLKESGGNSES